MLQKVEVRGRTVEQGQSRMEVEAGQKPRQGGKELKPKLGSLEPTMRAPGLLNYLLLDSPSSEVCLVPYNHKLKTKLQVEQHYSQQGLKLQMEERMEDSLCHCW